MEPQGTLTPNVGPYESCWHSHHVHMDSVHINIQLDLLGVWEEGGGKREDGSRAATALCTGGTRKKLQVC